MNSLKIFDNCASKDFKSDLERVGTIKNVELIFERKVGVEIWYDVLISVFSSNPNIDFDINATLTNTDENRSAITNIALHEVKITNPKVLSILIRRLKILEKYYVL